MKQTHKTLAVNILLILICVVISYSASRMVQSAFATKTESAEMAAKIEELKTKKQQLEARLVELQTKEAIEREAKERLNLKKTGEEVVVVVPEKKDNATTTPPLTLWEKIISIFKK